MNRNSKWNSPISKSSGIRKRNQELSIEETIHKNLKTIAETLRGKGITNPEKKIIKTKHIVHKKSCPKAATPRITEIRNIKTYNPLQLLCHPIDTFFLLMANTVKRFSSEDQHFVRCSIFNLINGIEKKKLNTESKFKPHVDNSTVTEPLPDVKPFAVKREDLDEISNI